MSYPSTRGTQGAIRRDSHCVQETTVANVVGLQLAISQVPHLRDTNIALTCGSKTITVTPSHTSCALINYNIHHQEGQVIHAIFFF